MNATYTVEVEALANVHGHYRESEEPEVMQPLVEYAITGGSDIFGPMPNTKEGLKTAGEVLAYSAKLARFVPAMAKATILPIMLVNEETTPQMIDECITNGIVDCKVYPLDRTTQSKNGVGHYGRIMPIMKHCGKVGMKRHFHPEHPSMIYGNREAEYAFLPIIHMLLDATEGVIIWEHGSDGRCIPHWKEFAKSGRFFMNITAHHAATNEDAAFGDVRKKVKPTIKTADDQRALVDLIMSDYDWVHGALDDAPHPNTAKHVHVGKCQCGAYTAPFGLQLYAHVFGDRLLTFQGLRTFISFTSRNARRLHNLSPASRKIKLVKEPFQVPLSYKVGPWTVEPPFAGEIIDYTIVV